MDYKIKNIKLASQGRKQIDLAEKEMPGLIALRKKYGSLKPLKGAKITGSLHMTVETAVLIETLKELGANIRWASCNIYSTNDEAAAAVVEKGVPVFAWKGETLKDYWMCTKQALNFDGEGPDLIVDDGGDSTLLVHKGVEVEKNPSLLEKSFKEKGEDYFELITLIKNTYSEDKKMTNNDANLKKVYNERQIVVFKLGDEEFGVDIKDVREIIKMESITKIPNTEKYVSGVINLRGSIIVVIDLEAKLELTSKDANKDTRIIVVEVEGQAVGMIVDFCNEVMYLNSDQIEPAPTIITKKIDSDYITGVGVLKDRLIILLDFANILKKEDIKKISDKHNSKQIAKEIEVKTN